MSEGSCVECINYFKCGDKEWRSCKTSTAAFPIARYWNQNIFVDELMEYAGVIQVKQTKRT